MIGTSWMFLNTLCILNHRLHKYASLCYHTFLADRLPCIDQPICKTRLLNPIGNYQGMSASDCRSTDRILSCTRSDTHQPLRQSAYSRHLGMDTSDNNCLSCYHYDYRSHIYYHISCRSFHCRLSESTLPYTLLYSRQWLTLRCRRYMPRGI